MKDWNRAFIFLGIWGLFMTLGSLRADTYNFYFPGKKNKPTVPVKTLPAEEAKTEDLEPAESPANETPSAVASVITEDSNSGSNTLSPSLSASASARSAPFFRRYRFGVGALAAGQSYYPQEGNSSFMATYGGLLSLGYRFVRIFGLSGYAGARYAGGLGRLYLHLGTDAEFFPFSSSQMVADQLEWALLFGASTAQASEGNIGTFHFGSRLNVKVSEAIGFATVLRFNLGYIMLETGLITRF